MRKRTKAERARREHYIRYIEAEERRLGIEPSYSKIMRDVERELDEEERSCRKRDQ